MRERERERERKREVVKMASEALLAHKTRVIRLYRHSLKQMMSWAVQRTLIYEEMANIRSQFEANKNVVCILSTRREGRTKKRRTKKQRRSTKAREEFGFDAAGRKKGGEGGKGLLFIFLFPHA